jgi:hypothetical protein
MGFIGFDSNKDSINGLGIFIGIFFWMKNEERQEYYSVFP